MKPYRVAMKYGSPAALGLAMAGAAHAELPAAVSTMFTAVQTDALAAQALGWILFAAVVGGFVLFKVVRKVVGRST